MKTIKFKLCNSVTLTHPLAPLGTTPSGAIIFQVDGIPENVSSTKACQTMQGVVAPHRGNYKLTWTGHG